MLRLPWILFEEVHSSVWWLLLLNSSSRLEEGYWEPKLGMRPAIVPMSPSVPFQNEFGLVTGIVLPVIVPKCTIPKCIWPGDSGSVACDCPQVPSQNTFGLVTGIVLPVIIPKCTPSGKQLPAQKLTYIALGGKGCCHRSRPEVGLFSVCFQVFCSIKGIYYQADIFGETVTWIVPHKYGHDVSTHQSNSSHCLSDLSHHLSE